MHPDNHVRSSVSTKKMGAFGERNQEHIDHNAAAAAAAKSVSSRTRGPEAGIEE
jgi:hypothetical protein